MLSLPVAAWADPATTGDGQVFATRLFIAGEGVDAAETINPATGRMTGTFPGEVEAAAAPACEPKD